ncbi:MAG: transcription factor S [Acidilobaceae archaeon]
MLRFCPKCGALMQSKREPNGSNSLVCPRCGYSERTQEPITIQVKSNARRSPKDKTLVLNSEKSLETAQTVSTVCPKCGNDRAYFWMMQTRAADEPPTRFYRCTKCGYTWREYA